jgi:hypothetical protein
MKYREVINEQRRIDDARRIVDEKTEQLKAIAEISTIIAGTQELFTANWTQPHLCS